MGTEKIGGVDAVKVKGVIPADALSEVINASGMMNEESIGLTGELLESLFKDMDDMEVYFWFNPETLYPVKYEMDMTNLMSSLYENLFAMLGAEAEGVSVNVSKVLISMEISNINNATEFTIPEEALSPGRGGKWDRSITESGSQRRSRAYARLFAPLSRERILEKYGNTVIY